MFNCLLKQFWFQISEINFSSNKEQQGGPQVHFTQPVQL
jgi:hypothetical protein